MSTYKIGIQTFSPLLRELGIQEVRIPIEGLTIAIDMNLFVYRVAIKIIEHSATLGVERTSVACAASVGRALGEYRGCKLILCWDGARDIDKVDRGKSPFDTSIIRSELSQYDHMVSDSEGEMLACQVGADIVWSNDTDCYIYLHRAICRVYDEFEKSIIEEVDRLMKGSSMSKVLHNVKKTSTGWVGYLKIDGLLTTGDIPIIVHSNDVNYCLDYTQIKLQHIAMASVKLGRFYGAVGMETTRRSNGVGDIYVNMMIDLLSYFPVRGSEKDKDDIVRIATLLGTDYNAPVMGLNKVIKLYSTKSLNTVDAYYNNIFKLVKGKYDRVETKTDLAVVRQEIALDEDEIVETPYRFFLDYLDMP